MPQLICACTSLTWYIPLFELDDSLVAFAHLVTDDRFELRESAAEPFECTFIRKSNAHHLGIDVMNQPFDQKLQANTSIIPKIKSIKSGVESSQSNRTA